MEERCQLLVCISNEEVDAQSELGVAFALGMCHTRRTIILDLTQQQTFSNACMDLIQGPTASVYFDNAELFHQNHMEKTFLSAFQESTYADTVVHPTIYKMCLGDNLQSMNLLLMSCLPLYSIINASSDAKLEQRKNADQNTKEMLEKLDSASLQSDTDLANIALQVQGLCSYKYPCANLYTEALLVLVSCKDKGICHAMTLFADACIIESVNFSSPMPPMGTHFHSNGEWESVELGKMFLSPPRMESINAAFKAQGKGLCTALCKVLQDYAESTASAQNHDTTAKTMFDVDLVFVTPCGGETQSLEQDQYWKITAKNQMDFSIPLVPIYSLDVLHPLCTTQWGVIGNTLTNVLQQKKKLPKQLLFEKKKEERK